MEENTKDSEVNKTDDGEKPMKRLSCPLCPKRFKMWRALKHHLAQSHFQNKFLTLSGSTLTKCGICGKTCVGPESTQFRRERGIAYHLAFSHGLLEQLIPQDLQTLKLGQKLEPSKSLLRIKEEIKQPKHTRKSKSNISPARSPPALNKKEVELIRSSQVKIEPESKNNHTNMNTRTELLQSTNEEEQQWDFALINLESSHKIMLTPKSVRVMRECQKLQPQIVLSKIDKYDSLLGTGMYLKKRSKTVKKAKKNYEAKRQCVFCQTNFKSMQKLKRHLAGMHFADKLLEMSNSSLSECGICTKKLDPKLLTCYKKSRITWHLANSHDLLRQVMPEGLGDVANGSKFVLIEKTPTQGVIKMDPKMTLLGNCQKWQCVFCPYIGYRSSQNIKQHLALCHFKNEILSKLGSSLHQCGFCSRSFPYKNKADTMIVHLTSQHDFLRQLIPQEQYKEMFESKPRLQCFLCSNIFINMHSLQYHLAQYHFLNKLCSMSGSSSYNCGMCGKLFTNPGRAKSRVEHLMASHLGFKHGLLKQILSQSCQAEPQKQSVKKIQRDIPVVDEPEKKKSRIDLPMFEEATKEESE